MAKAPRFKVYDSKGQYQVACKEPEAAAAVVSIYGQDTFIKDGHRRKIFRREGNEEDGYSGWANESYDIVALSAVMAAQVPYDPNAS